MRRIHLLLASTAIVTVLSCAYYNTFWMAKSDYTDALQNGGYDFWDPYAQPPVKGDTERLVDSCIERCGKLLLLHPNSRWVDDALYIMGNCFVLKEEYQNALRKYDEILQLYGTSEFAPMAKYMKAYTLIREGSTQQGVDLLVTLSKESKLREIRERAFFVLGRVAVEQNNRARAISFFETYLADYPGGVRADMVRLHLAAALLQSGQADRVISVLEPLATKQGEEGLQAALMMGEAYRGTGENDRAIEIFTRLVERAVEDTVRARAKMETARTLVARGEAEQALGTLDEAAEIAAAKNKELQDEIIFTKGLIYEKNLQDFDAAVTAYDRIAKSKSGYGKSAGRRSAALKKVQEFTTALGDTLPRSPEQEAEQRFKLGETYLDDLGLRDEALIEFKMVADSLPDTGFGPQAMLRTASLFEAGGDSVAQVYYRKVIETSPGSVYANFARSRLGLPLVDVEIRKPVVWGEGEVVGPFLPPPSDSLPSLGPDLPVIPESRRASPDTAALDRRSSPDSLEGGSRISGPAGFRFPQPEADTTDTVDSLGWGAGSDTTGAGAPADSAGPTGRWTP